MLASTIIWHQRDLRVHDNALYHDLPEGQPVLGVYIFNPDDYERQPSCAEREWDVMRTGPHQAVCILDAVADLRASLRELGTDLIVRHGDPASVLPPLCRLLGAREVRWHETAGTDEAELSARVYRAVRKAGVSVKTDLGCTLVHPDDLPRSSQEWHALAFPRQKHQRKKDKRGGGGGGGSGGGGGGGGGGSASTSGGHGAAVMPGRVDISQHRLASMPPVMGDWRRAVRARAKPRPPLAAPQRLVPPLALLPDASEPVDAGALPSLERLMQAALPPHDEVSARPDGHRRQLFGLPDDVLQGIIASASAVSSASRPSAATASPSAATANHQRPSASAEFVTERAARAQLQAFVREGHAARADRSLAGVGRHGSAKIGAALALGSLTPRQVYAAASGLGSAAGHAVAGGDGEVEAGERGGGDSSPSSLCSSGEAAWLGSHMEMRDFFVYAALATGPSLFRQAGAPVAATHAPLSWRAPANAQDEWYRWATGRTGLPLVDAAMRELASSGYCSNRVRQNAASLLTKDLGIDWRAGAEWFQFLLADHDLAANWGNWRYFAGVGADPKQRHFKTVSQAAKYDPRGEYVRQWCPELAALEDVEAVLRPFDLAPAVWPRTPLVEPAKHLVWQDTLRLEQTGRIGDVGVPDGGGGADEHVSAAAEVEAVPTL